MYEQVGQDSVDQSFLTKSSEKSHNFGSGIALLLRISRNCNGKAFGTEVLRGVFEINPPKAQVVIKEIFCT